MRSAPGGCPALIHVHYFSFIPSARTQIPQPPAGFLRNAGPAFLHFDGVPCERHLHQKLAVHGQNGYPPALCFTLIDV